MQHIVTIDRHQVSFSSLEELVTPDDPVRFLDAFVSIVVCIILYRLAC